MIKTAGDLDGLFRRDQRAVRLGALIKCSISVKIDDGRYSYKMKDILAADKRNGGAVQKIAETCVRKHMPLTGKNRLFVLLGLDASYIRLCKGVFGSLCGNLSSNTEIDYFTKRFSWVHVAHPSGQQPDRQFYQWVRGETKKPKVRWARTEIARRLALRKR